MICICGHLEDKHYLHLETYNVCETCHEEGKLRIDFIHDFKIDNLRYLEIKAADNEDKSC